MALPSWPIPNGDAMRLEPGGEGQDGRLGSARSRAKPGEGGASPTGEQVSDGVGGGEQRVVERRV